MTFSISCPTLATGNRSIFFFVGSFSIGFTMANTELKNDGAFRIMICTQKRRAKSRNISHQGKADRDRKAHQGKADVDCKAKSTNIASG